MRSRSRQPARGLACALALFGAGLLAPTAGASDGAQILAWLNAQRAAHGLPASIVERPYWSEGCRKHIEYGRRNGGWNPDPREETPGRPGYTQHGSNAGARAALRRMMWASAGASPFEAAPIQLAQALNPKIVESGASTRKRYVCLVTQGKRQTAAANALYVYPADGTEDWYREQTAVGWPFTPGELVGIPRFTTTGPHLYVFADGPFSASPTDRPRIAAATLTGPSGPVEVRWVDSATPVIGPYLPAGGIVIPVRRLDWWSTYTASVTVAQGDTELTRTWSFTTALQPNHVDIELQGGSSTVHVVIFSRAGNLTATVRQPSGTTFVPELQWDLLNTWEGYFQAQGYGRGQVCAQSGGGSYEPASACASFYRRRSAAEFLEFPPLARGPGTVQVRVGATGPLRGRPARLLVRLLRGCGHAPCGTSTEIAYRRITLRAGLAPYSFALRPGRYVARIFVAPFRAGGVPYESITRTRSLRVRG